jgi:DNA-binding HxlR family transcriptional regulator
MKKINIDSVRGSTTGRPVMQIFDVLGTRWTMRILWELRSERLSFRELRGCCDNVSPTVLNQRIKTLREMDIVDHQTSGYGLTKWGEELGNYLIQLDIWSKSWSSRE